MGTYVPLEGPMDECRLDSRTQGRERMIPHNLHDLASFLEDGIIWGEGRHIFEADYSIGFTSGNYLEFAIDGADAPFILRSMGENQYKIVSDCYL